ncbi:MAG TPA: hypothetical protein VHG33_00875 [Woeseiaceae bacterium]|nr:hypothetical protein [Woeseiaceae bacterium]
MTVLIATSVVRGSQQGESHGGVFLVDLERERVAQTIDWNTADIDWQGRGWDRGLRGIAFDGDRIFIAASDELFVYDRDFNRVASYRSPYLKHCHEISRYKRRLYLTSTGFDSLLAFDLDANRFSWGLAIGKANGAFRAVPFDPAGEHGPAPANALHLNSVYATERGLYVSGLRTGGMLKFDGRRIVLVATLPDGTHNARPYQDGVLFNDSQADVVRFASPHKQRVFRVPRYAEGALTHREAGDARIARQAFARGLCVVDEDVIAAGSSPSTIALHDLQRVKTTLTVTLSHDIRNAIHGLEVWPYGDF